MGNQPWTVERVQELLQDPGFIQASQSVVQSNPSGLTDEEYSTLTDAEKAQFTSLQDKINRLEQANNQAMLAQQDTQLKTRYANYDPKQVDELMQGLMQNKVQATREHLWKVVDYDNAVERAYQMGLQDRKMESTDKYNSMSLPGQTSTPTGTVDPEKNESGVNFFRRIALKRLAESKQGQSIRS